MLAGVRAQLLVPEFVLKTMARRLIEWGLIAGHAAAADVDDAARPLGAARDRTVVEIADAQIPALLRDWARFFRGPFTVSPETS